MNKKKFLTLLLLSFLPVLLTGKQASVPLNEKFVSGPAEPKMYSENYSEDNNTEKMLIYH